MASIIIHKPTVIKHALDPGDEFTFPVQEGEVHILAFAHPYQKACAGLYLVMGGYSTWNEHCIIPILETNVVTITKTQSQECKVTATDSVFLSVHRGGVNTSLPSANSPGVQHDEYDKTFNKHCASAPRDVHNACKQERRYVCIDNTERMDIHSYIRMFVFGVGRVSLSNSNELSRSSYSNGRSSRECSRFLYSLSNSEMITTISREEVAA